MQVHHRLSKELNASALVGFGTTVDVRDSNRYILAFAYPSPTLTKEDYAGDSPNVAAFEKYIFPAAISRMRPDTCSVTS